MVPLLKTVISMKPNAAGDDGTQGVIGLPPCFCDMFPSTKPPYWERIIGCRREELPTILPEAFEPNFMTKHTSDQEVVDGFRLLVAKRTGVTLHAMSLQWFRCPTTILDCQPYKKLKLVRGFNLPYFLSSQNSRLAIEHSEVCRLR
jgi:hypothetical protein